MNGRTSRRSRTGVGALVREGTPMLKLVSGDGRPDPTRPVAEITRRLA